MRRPPRPGNRAASVFFFYVEPVGRRLFFYVFVRGNLNGHGVFFFGKLENLGVGL